MSKIDYYNERKKRKTYIILLKICRVNSIWLKWVFKIISGWNKNNKQMEKIGIRGIFWGKGTLSVTEMTGKKSRFRAFATLAKKGSTLMQNRLS